MFFPGICGEHRPRRALKWRTKPIALNSAFLPVSSQADAEDGLRSWVGAHPELRRLMSDLVTAVLRDKPDDPVAYAKDWVASLDTGASSSA